MASASAHTGYENSPVASSLSMPESRMLSIEKPPADHSRIASRDYFVYHSVDHRSSTINHQSFADLWLDTRILCLVLLCICSKNLIQLALLGGCSIHYAGLLAFVLQRVFLISLYNCADSICLPSIRTDLFVVVDHDFDCCFISADTTER